MRPRKTNLFDDRRCENCAHFFQHYVDYGNGSFRPCYCGHCGKPRIKNVKPDMTCDLFAEKPELKCP